MTRAACCAWPPRPAGARATACSRPSRACPSPLWWRRCARPWPSTCSSRMPTATPSATRCCRRPPTPTCSPGSGPRCTSRWPRPCATTRAWPTAPRRPSSRCTGARPIGCPRRWPRTCAPGLEAEQVFAFVEAAQHFERALEIWDLVEDAAERTQLDLLDVVTHAAHNTHIAGEHHRAVTLGRMAIELADRGGDVICSAFARERVGRYLWIAGDSDGSLAAYRDAVRMLPPDPPTPALARVLAAEAQILMLRAPGEETRAACERAIDIARAVGARAFEGHALNSLGVTRFGSGDFAGGERALREAKAIAEEVSDHDGIWRAYTNLSECLDEQGRLEEAAALALEGAAQRRSPGHADLRALPAGRGVLAPDAPGPARRDGGDRRARARPGAQGRGRGRPARQRRPPRHAPRPPGQRGRALRARPRAAGRHERLDVDRQPGRRTGRDRALGGRSRPRVADRHRRAGLRPRGPVRPLHDAAARDGPARGRRPRPARAAPSATRRGRPRRSAKPGRSSPACAPCWRPSAGTTGHRVPSRRPSTR